MGSSSICNMGCLYMPFACRWPAMHAQPLSRRLCCNRLLKQQHMRASALTEEMFKIVHLGKRSCQ